MCVHTPIFIGKVGLLMGKMSVILKKISALILLAILGIMMLSGCSQSETTEATDEPAYAGAIAESILNSFNTGDYTVYSERFDPAMKKAMPEADFKELRSQVREEMGDYISKEYSSQETVQEIYTAVIYKVEFSKNPGDVQIRVVFLETDDAVYVSGLWFQ